MALKRTMVDAKNPKRGHWSMGLKNSMEDPELIVESDDEIVIIRDKFPKAKYHFLVLPKASISSLKALKQEHVDLLKHMEAKGKQLAERTDSSAKFKFGYHAVPSMNRLHLHVISQDFCSPCLKSKKHWNSFTTEFFIDSSVIIQELETKGFVSTINVKESEELLKKPLKCHICTAEISNLPKLKIHLSRHFD